MWDHVLDGGFFVVSLALIYFSFLFHAKAELQTIGRGDGVVEASAGVGACTQEPALRLGWEDMRSLSRCPLQWVSVGAPVRGAEVQKARESKSRRRGPRAAKSTSGRVGVEVRWYR